MTLAEFQCIQRPEEVRAQRADAIAPVFAGRPGAGEIIHPVDGNIRQSFANIPPDKVKIGICRRSGEIGLCSGLEIVVAPDLMAKLEEPVAKMRADEPGSPCNQYFQVRPPRIQ